MAVAVMGLVLLLSQSCSGLVGLAASLAVLVLGPWRWGRWILITLVTIVLALFLTAPLGEFLLRTDDATRVVTVDGGINVAIRFEVWEQAFYGIQDFPFTGMGLGTFRQIVTMLYPMFLVPPTYDIAHAHNFFLQTALDFGLPGLVAMLAIYMVALIQCSWLYRNAWVFGMAEYSAIGLTAALVTGSV